MYAIHPDRDYGAIVKLGPGDFYGEMGLVRGMKSSIIIQALTNCEVWLLNRKIYLELLEHLPQDTKHQILINYLDILQVHRNDFFFTLSFPLVNFQAFVFSGY